jgi:hypothetical protein
MNHDDLAKLLVLIIVVIFVVAASRKKSDPEEKRRRDLAALAKKLQLQFNPNSDFKLAERFSFLTWLNRGVVRYAYNVFHGNHLEYPMTIFDYTFSAGKYSYYWSAYILEMNAHFPDMIISHESWESRFTEAFGESHIIFESAEFSHAFRVRSSDRKFTFDVCHPKMMEYLLANRDLIIEIRGDAVAVLFEDWLRPEKIEANLSRLIEIQKLLPDYLFKKN